VIQVLIFQRNMQPDAMNRLVNVCSSFSPLVVLNLQRSIGANRLFMVPFGRDPSFLGRADVIRAISREYERLAMGFHTRVALVGLGGIG
jgi:hypothetical protein